MFGASGEEKLCINLNIGNNVLNLQQVEFSKYLAVYIVSILMLAGNTISISFVMKSLNLPASFTRYKIFCMFGKQDAL